MTHSKSFMHAPASALHSANWRMGTLIKDSGIKIFQIATTLNTDTFPSNFSFLQKREGEWSLRDRAAFAATSTALDLAPSKLARNILQGIKAPHALRSVYAGEVEAVHEKILEQRPLGRSEGLTLTPAGRQAAKVGQTLGPVVGCSAPS